MKRLIVMIEFIDDDFAKMVMPSIKKSISGIMGNLTKIARDKMRIEIKEEDSQNSATIG